MPSAARVAGNDAPRIGERAATGGRIATDGGDAHAGAKRRYPLARQLRKRPRRATGPGTLTVVSTLVACVAGTLIGERAATRGRIAMECSPRCPPTSKTGTPAANDATRDARTRRYAPPYPPPATTCPSSANAPQRAGARRKGRWARRCEATLSVRGRYLVVRASADPQIAMFATSFLCGVCIRSSTQARKKVPMPIGG